MTKQMKRFLAANFAISSLTLTAVTAIVSTKKSNTITALLAAIAAEGVAGSVLLLAASKDPGKKTDDKNKSKKNKIRRFLDVTEIFDENEDYSGFTVTDNTGRMHECTLYELKVNGEAN